MLTQFMLQLYNYNTFSCDTLSLGSMLLTISHKYIHIYDDIYILHITYIILLRLLCLMNPDNIIIIMCALHACIYMNIFITLGSLRGIHYTYIMKQAYILHSNNMEYIKYFEHRQSFARIRVRISVFIFQIRSYRVMFLMHSKQN